MRVESPEPDFAVEKALLEHGIAEAEAEGAPVMSAKQIQKASFDRGLILHPRKGYLGFRQLLRSFAQQLASASHVEVMNTPADIEIMFDKPRCHQRTRAAGLPVPQALGRIRCYEELVLGMNQHGFSRVFVKLANGSSGSGVVALNRIGNRPTAITTTEIVTENKSLKLYNSRRIRCYTNEREIAGLIDAICRERVHVERWLPKATLDEHGNFDLRVVVIAGRASHVIMRQSCGPITNLHLLNRRGDVNHLRARMGTSCWTALQSTCENAMSVFPDSLYSGIDVLLLPDLRRHAILEMNDFGDLLPNQLLHGQDTYATELSGLTMRKLGQRQRGSRV